MDGRWGAGDVLVLLRIYEAPDAKARCEGHERVAATGGIAGVGH